MGETVRSWLQEVKKEDRKSEEGNREGKDGNEENEKEENEKGVVIKSTYGNGTRNWAVQKNSK